MFKDKIEQYARLLKTKYESELNKIESYLESLKDKEVKMVLLNVYVIDEEFGEDHTFKRDVIVRCLEHNHNCEVSYTYQLDIMYIAKILYKEQDIVKEIKIVA